jgi:hypothetical protein
MADGGYTSYLAFWIGGASNFGAAPAQNAGYRSFTAIWMGGASNFTFVPPPPSDGGIPPDGYIVYCGRLMNRGGGG